MAFAGQDSERNSPFTVFIHTKFLGLETLQSTDISDIELGGLLYRYGKRRQWNKKRLQCEYCCDLQDVSRFCIHPYKDRVFGLVLRDRESGANCFICLKCHKGIKAYMIQSLYHSHIQQHSSCSDEKMQDSKEKVINYQKRTNQPLPPTPLETAIRNCNSSISHNPKTHVQLEVGYGVVNMDTSHQPPASQEPVEHTYEPIPYEISRSPTYENLLDICDTSAPPR